MPIKLASTEKLVREYHYATVHYGRNQKNDVSKSVIVTDKRIISREERLKKGRESIVTEEVPISAVKYVNTLYGRTSKKLLLVLSIICFCTLVLLPLGIAFLVGYLRSRKSSVSCEFLTDAYITGIFSMDSASYNSKIAAKEAKKKHKSRKAMKIVVDVDDRVARDFVEEIGALILDYANGAPEVGLPATIPPAATEA